MNHSSSMFLNKDENARSEGCDGAAPNADYRGRDERSQAAAPCRQSRAARGLPPKKLLLVDEDPASGELLTTFLALKGFAVLSVSYTAEMGDVARRFEPDIVIIDLLAGRSQGIALAEMIREAGFVETPMVAICGTPAMLRVAALDGYFQAYVEKPLDVLDFVCVLQTLADA